MKNIAIILAAGKGKRMKTMKPKQFLSIGGEPMLTKSLQVFEKSPVIDEIIVVIDEKHKDECKRIVKNSFHKVKSIVIGGRERYDSVYAGLKACKNCRYVFIHDSARPYVDQDIINRAYEAVKEFPACAVGMPAKDTVKIVNKDGYVLQTPPRDRVWIIQTPQVFRYDLIREAYDIMAERSMKGITDDAMVVEASGISRVRLVEGSYDNIKITTPDDLKAEYEAALKAEADQADAKEAASLPEKEAVRDGKGDRELRGDKEKDKDKEGKGGKEGKKNKS